MGAATGSLGARSWWGQVWSRPGGHRREWVGVQQPHWAASGCLAHPALSSQCRGALGSRLGALSPTVASLRLRAMQSVLNRISILGPPPGPPRPLTGHLSCISIGGSEADMPPGAPSAPPHLLLRRLPVTWRGSVLPTLGGGRLCLLPPPMSGQSKPAGLSLPPQGSHLRQLPSSRLDGWIGPLAAPSATTLALKLHPTEPLEGSWPTLGWSVTSLPKPSNTPTDPNGVSASLTPAFYPKATFKT